jgi:hypothetical protein
MKGVEIINYNDREDTQPDKHDFTILTQQHYKTTTKSQKTSHGATHYHHTTRNTQDYTTKISTASHDKQATSQKHNN